MNTSGETGGASDSRAAVQERGLFAGGMRWVWAIAAAKLALHLVFASRYGYFGDELYHLACGEHLDWGYVDQPPLIALVAWLVRQTLGESLLAVRALPALSGAALVVLAGLLARDLGARSFAMSLAALSTACIGALFVMHYLFTMNAFEPLFWMACALILLRIIRTGDQRLWLAFGLLAGLGLMNKYSMAVFAAGLVLGVLFTPERTAFRQKCLWLGGAVALLIFLPNLIWNIRHDWPFFELMRNIRTSGRDVALNPLEFIGHLIFLIGPIHFPLCVAGVAWLLFAKRARAYRPLGWGFAFTLLFFIAARGKDYYVVPAFPLALAAGAVVFEEWSGEAARRWLRPAAVALLLAVTLVFLPLVLPVLSPPQLERYLDLLPFGAPVSERSHAFAKFPHHFAWQFGWEELVAATAEVYHRLPPEERARTAILGNNFAQAGAVDLLGPTYGLPKAIGIHQSYWLWGHRGYSGDPMIVLGDEPEDLRQWCGSVEVGADFHPAYARPHESWMVLICRQPRMSLPETWPLIKNWR